MFRAPLRNSNRKKWNCFPLRLPLPYLRNSVKVEKTWDSRLVACKWAKLVQPCKVNYCNRLSLPICPVSLCPFGSLLSQSPLGTTSAYQMPCHATTTISCFIMVLVEGQQRQQCVMAAVHTSSKSSVPTHIHTYIFSWLWWKARSKKDGSTTDAAIPWGQSKKFVVRNIRAPVARTAHMASALLLVWAVLTPPQLPPVTLCSFWYIIILFLPPRSSARICECT